MGLNDRETNALVGGLICFVIGFWGWICARALGVLNVKYGLLPKEYQNEETVKNIAAGIKVISFVFIIGGIFFFLMFLKIKQH